MGCAEGGCALVWNGRGEGAERADAACGALAATLRNPLDDVETERVWRGCETGVRRTRRVALSQRQSEPHSP